MAVTRLNILGREPLLDGMAFGKTGPYEVLRGTVTCAVDPAVLPNQGIADLDKAPRNAAGQVECWADVVLLQPADPQKGNRRLLFEVVNRGRILAFRMFDSAAETPNFERLDHLGKGFLLEQGYTMAWCGWQWDVMRVDGLFGLGVPQAMDGNTPVSGQVLCQWQPNAPAPFLMLSHRGHQPYPTMDVEDPEAVLTVRDEPHGPRQVIPRQQWRFARVTRGEAVPATTYVWLTRGFQAGKIYECIYRTKQAPVAGMGFIAVRDTVTYLKHETDPQHNPCAGHLDYAYGFGASQSGRFLRHFLYLGLNTDESGRQVFDAVMPHIAASRRGEFNQRFAQPSAVATEGPSNLFPFTDNEQLDPITGQRDGLLRRLQASGHCPKIFYVNTSAEYWGGAASLIHTSVDGSTDVALPENVRVYHMAGTQHTPGPLPLTSTAGDGARGQHALNSVNYVPLLRALLQHLDAWVSHNTTPPPSRYPRLADATAVTAASLAPVFQALPHSPFPSILPQSYRLDFGPAWEQGVASCLPPRVGEPYPTFVAAVDQDGNEVAGIRLPDLTVPLATYTGWNLRHPSQGGPGQTLGNQGATLPLAPTAEVRAQSGDPRLSIAERYPSKEHYVELVTKAAEALVAEGYLLAMDVSAVVQRAGWKFDLLSQQQ